MASKLRETQDLLEAVEAEKGSAEAQVTHNKQKQQQSINEPNDNTITRPKGRAVYRGGEMFYVMAGSHLQCKCSISMCVLL